MPTAVVAPQTVAAELNFLSPTLKEKPFYYRTPPAGKPESNIVVESQAVNITDLRTLSASERNAFTIDSAGFQIVEHQTVEKDFVDEDAIRNVYYKETEELLKSVTGATRVFIFDHTIRRRKAGEAETPENRGPGLRAHVDQTPKAGAARVHHHLGEEAERLSKGRVQIINVWRPIKPVVATPLAYGDYHTFDVNKDLAASDLIYPDRVGETYNIRYNPSQKWYYLKNQTPGEVVLLKCYDSEDKPGRALLTPHSAFIDPTAPADAPPRESIEIRALVFYEN
ncbi:hypothetical protein EXIGLDRAFT_626964 [Exidia glandulosa HHB12029]|uniref:Methyltransferase n=1 Tax=Exidia glandulosa HHB12029 TaxID=1314781 RepID=A0A165CHN8_EXIGL|nr:hypothetical protein EXIGLDRAFT_626964 [Exidia glandulosa HHB12029]